MRSGAEFDAVASVQLLLGESAEENRRTMEEADKKNADAAMDAVYTFAPEAAEDINKAIKWLLDISERWPRLREDHFAKKEWPDGPSQLRRQIGALKKRRNAGND
jgi:vesicle coat complex subunit